VIFGSRFEPLVVKSASLFWFRVVRSRRRLHLACALSKGSCFAASEKPRGLYPAEEFNQIPHEASPTGPVAGAKTGTVISVEVLVEEQIILPVGIGLDFCVPPELPAPVGRSILKSSP